MATSIPQLTALLVLSTSAVAQVGVEDFEGGNPDGWELWFSVYNSIEPTGGNPGAYLELDNFTSGPATCHYVEIFPDRSGPGLLHSGDWRAAGVGSVSIDLDVQQGLYLGDLTLRLVSDPGTPGTTSDDCVLSILLPMAGAGAAGWRTYTFDVPTAQATLPPGWEVLAGSPCSPSLPDIAWNAVVRDVDWIEFRYDGNPPAFCQFTSWMLGVDNIAVSGSGLPLGTNYCDAVDNSTGVAAVLGGEGSASVADNDVTLTCSSMPNNAFGFFLT
ncbi:MAG: hypothetical protein AAGB93_20170, partial [Planctomycetota bacterium]